MQGLGPYSKLIKNAEKEIKEMAKKVNDLCGMSSFSSIFVVIVQSDLSNFELFELMLN